MTSSMPRMDHDAELDQMVAELTEAGLVETYVDEDGKDAMRLTPEGEKVARQLAMSDDDDRDALLLALLGEQGGR